MWAREAHRDLVLPQYLLGGAAGMIARVVQDKHHPGPPSWLLHVQLLHQMLQEDLNDLGVGVALEHGEINAAIGVQAGDDGDSRLTLRTG